MALRLLCSHTGCGSHLGNSAPHTPPGGPHHDGGHHVGDADAVMILLSGVKTILLMITILVYVCMDYDAVDANAMLKMMMLMMVMLMTISWHFAT